MNKRFVIIRIRDDLLEIKITNPFKNGKKTRTERKNEFKSLFHLFGPNLTFHRSYIL